MEIRLDELAVGKKAVVKGFGCSQLFRQRLRDFGLVEGMAVKCCYRSPDGGLTALSVRGTILAIRRENLAKIAVEPI